MFAKSFLALGGNASLIGTKTAQPPLTSAIPAIYATQAAFYSATLN